MDNDKRQADPEYTREQLAGARDIGVSRDVLLAALEEGKTYTIKEAKIFASRFLGRKV